MSASRLNAAPTIIAPLERIQEIDRIRPRLLVIIGIKKKRETSVAAVRIQPPHSYEATANGSLTFYDFQ